MSTLSLVESSYVKSSLGTLTEKQRGAVLTSSQMDVKENYISVKITLRKDGGSNIWKVQKGIKFAADNCTALLKISSYQISWMGRD